MNYKHILFMVRKILLNIFFIYSLTVSCVYICVLIVPTPFPFLPDTSQHTSPSCRHVCSWWHSIAVVEHSDQSNLGKKGFISVYISGSKYITQGIRVGTRAGQEPIGRNWSRVHRGTQLAGLPLLLLYTAQNLKQQVHCPQWAGIINQRCLRDIATGQSDLGNPLIVDSSSQKTKLC